MTDRPGADLLGRTRQGAPGGAEGNTIQPLLGVLRRRWAAIAACALTACAAAVALSVRQEREYASSASLLFRDAGLDEAVLGSSAGGADPQREAATNLDLGAVAPIAARTAERLRVPGVDRDDVSSSVDISSNGDSDVASVSATTGDPEMSARMANVYAEEYVAFRHASDQARVAEAAREVRRRLVRLTPSSSEGFADAPCGSRRRRSTRWPRSGRAARSSSSGPVRTAIRSALAPSGPPAWGCCWGCC